MSDDLPMPTCRHCGLGADVHHAFEPYCVPPGCKCEPNDWGNPHDIPKVCGGPFASDEYKLCRTCEHLAECHGATP